MRAITVSGMLLIGALADAAEPGLVGQWSFNEGQGVVAHDSSGKGNHGRIIKARWVKNRSGACLEFDGQTSCVDCGDTPSLSLTTHLTLEAWIFPTAAARGEPGIVGKQFSRFLLTYYTDGQVYFYVGAGGNNANTAVPVGSWSHLAATFDGQKQHLYLNGKLLDSHTSRFAAVPAGGRFVIGCVAGDLAADDPNYRATAHFEGLIDEVRVYNRPLSAEEIAAHAAADAPAFEIVQDYRSVKPALTMNAGGAAVDVASDGAFQINRGGDSVAVRSHLSYAGEQVGWNALGTDGEPQPGWQPSVRKISPTCSEVTARATAYEVRRRLTLLGESLEIEDTIANTGSDLIGLMSRHEFVNRDRFSDCFSPGGAETPFIYMRSAGMALGVVMEDNLSRMRFEPRTAVRVNGAGYRLSNMGIRPGGSLTFRWTVMLMPETFAYYDFINALRWRWHANYTVAGPLFWMDMEDPKLQDAARLKQYLERKRVNVMLLSPWLDYDSGRWDHVWPRPEFKEKAIRAAAALKAVQPDIKVLGCIETDWVTIYPERIPHGDKLPVYGKGGGGLNKEQTEIIKKSGLPFVDSIKYAQDGTTWLELYSRGGKPQTALSVYPAIGNYQYEFLMGQVKFLIDDCGLDGYYIDEFSQGWNGGIKNYGGWDGFSVDINPLTGRVVNRWIDCSIAGIGARVNLVQYALGRGKIVVANTYATAMEENGLPVNRFSETQGQFDPFSTATGQKPRGLIGLFRSSLGSPIGLGIVGKPENRDTAQRWGKALITYLRHGMVSYHYAIEDIPQEGPGSGAYGHINQMLPITPLELGEGFIRGHERIVTCVSGSYHWEQARQPAVLAFDIEGREVPVQATLKQTGTTWLVTIRLRDWAEIAVVEPAVR